MTRTEGYSWLAFISIGLLAWLAAGVPGLLCLIAGAIVSNIDVSWIEEGTKQQPESKPTATGWKRIDIKLQPKQPRKVRRRKVAKALPDNVVELKPRTEGLRTAAQASNRKPL